MVIPSFGIYETDRSTHVLWQRWYLNSLDYSSHCDSICLLVSALFGLQFSPLNLNSLQYLPNQNPTSNTLGHKICSCCFSRCHAQLFVTPWTVAHQSPLSRGFSRQESWSWLPFPSPGNLADPRIKPVSAAFAGRFFTTKSPRKTTRHALNLT